MLSHLCHFFIFFSFMPYFLLKKRFWHRCFPVNFVKFPRTPFFTENLRWLLLTTGISDRKNSNAAHYFDPSTNFIFTVTPGFKSCLPILHQFNYYLFFCYVRSVVALLFILRLYLFNRPIFENLFRNLCFLTNIAQFLEKGSSFEIRKWLPPDFIMTINNRDIFSQNNLHVAINNKNLQMLVLRKIVLTH